MSEKSAKYLLFEAEEEYALALSAVEEIIEFREITRVPDTPEYVTGIINLRGHVLPVLDIRNRFRKAPLDPQLRRCIVIAKIEDNLIGLIVDNVVDLIEIDNDQLNEVPQIGKNYIHAFVQYIGVVAGKMYLIVDQSKLVNYDELGVSSGLMAEDDGTDNTGHE